MQVTREIGIKMAVDSTAVAVGTAQAGRDLDRLGDAAERDGARATRSLSSVSLELKNIVLGAGALTVVSSLIGTVGDALASLPRDAFNYAKNIEASTVGMAGILGSMTAINGQQTQYNQALAISSQYIRRLNDDALRTAATSQELVATFQALLAPGLAANMTLEQIRQLSVVGTNAVKSIGLEANQVVQELRDLVAGGITAASSSLATALGLRDEDIAKAKASSEGLFAFLMARLKGFEASSAQFGSTLQGRIDSLKEGAVRVVAEGLTPLTNALKTTLGEASALFSVIDEGGNARLNPALVESLTQYAEGAAKAIDIVKQMVGGLYEHRDALLAVWGAYKALAIGAWAAEAVAAVRAKLDLAAAARLAATQASVEGAANVVVAQTTREKAAAYLAELEALRGKAQATLADASAQLAETTAKTASLAVSREAVIVSRAEVTAKLQATQATIAQAQAQLAASQAAGALSYALALQREATVTLSAAQARQAALVNELAVLGRQQATVAAAAAAATTAQAGATAAHTVAMAGAELASNQLAAATARGTLAGAAATLAARGFGTVLAALGGPVGIAVAALVGLVTWLFKAKGEADDAALATMRYKRAKDALAEGKPLEARDIASVSADLEKARQSLDEIEQRQTNNTAATARKAAAMAVAQAKVKEFEDMLAKAQSGAQGGTAGTGLTLSVAATQQAWEKTIAGAKTATAAQEEYQQKIDASRASFAAYKASLEGTAGGAEKLVAAQKRQTESEAAYATERDRKLKETNASAVTATTRTIDAQIEQLKRKAQLEDVLDKRATDQLQTRLQLGLVSEREYMEQVAAVELQGLAKNRDILTQQLAALKAKRDSDKEQATLSGQLAELDEKRLSRELTLKNALLVLDDRRRREAELLRQASLNQAQQSVDAIEEQNRATALEIQAIGLNEEAMHRLTTARMDDVIARQQERIAVLQSFDLAGQSQDLIDIEIRKLNALKDARNLNGQKYGVEQIAKINEAWLTLKNDVYQGLTDSLYRAFEAGGGFFSTFWAGIKNTLKTTVLKVSVQGVLNGVAGAVGLGGSTTAAASGTGAVSSIANLFQTGSTVYSAITTGFAGALGSAVSTVFGGVAGNAAIAASLTGSASSAVAAASAASVAAGGTAAGAGIGATIGSALGAIPVYGWAALAAAAAFAVFKGGETRMGGQYDTTRGLIAGPSGGEIAGQAVQQTITATVGGINDLFKTLGSAAQVTYYNAGLETSKNGKGFTYAGGTLADGTRFGNGFGTGYQNNRGDKTAEQALAEFEVERQQTIIQALQAATDIPTTIRDMLKGVDANALDAAGVKGVLDQISAVVGTVKEFGTVAAGLPFANLKNLSFDATASLIALAGGVEALGGKLSSYYNNFYSEEERTSQTVQNLTASLAAMGYALPTTRDGFRALVDAQDLSTDAGRRTYTSLLSMADAFASITAAAPAAVAGLDAAAMSLRAKWQDKLNLATGTVTAEDLALRDDLASTTDATTQALIRQVYAQNAATAAADQATAAAQKQTEWQDRLNLAIGATTSEAIALRDDLASTTDATTQALIRQVYAQNAAKASADAAAATAQTLAGWQDKLNLANGTVTSQDIALRDDLASTTDLATQAIIRQVYAQNAVTAAADAAAATAQTLAGWQDKLNLANGTVTSDDIALRNDLASTTDATTQAIIRQVYAQNAATAAADAAAAQAKTMASWQDRLDVLTGATTAEAQRLRDDLAGTTDAATQALIRQVYAQEIAQQAATELSTAWQSLTDSIFGEVQRIRDMMGGGSASTLAEVQAKFAISTAQARAGDQDAAKLLPALSQQLLTLAEASAGSLAELRRMQGQTAASLEQTANGLTNQYGLTTPSTAGGAGAVSADLQALIQRGERGGVDNSALLQALAPRAYVAPVAAGGNSDALVAEVRALRAEVFELRQTARSTDRFAEKTADLLTRVTENGRAMQTEDAT